MSLVKYLLKKEPLGPGEQLAALATGVALPALWPLTMACLAAGAGCYVAKRVTSFGLRKARSMVGALHHPRQPERHQLKAKR